MPALRITLLNYLVVVSCLPVLYSATAAGQIIHSTIPGGPWHVPSTWVGGIVPSAPNSSHVIIDGRVSIAPEAYPVQSPLVIDQLEIASGLLIVDAGAAVKVDGAASVAATGSLLASGDLIFMAAISVSGTFTALSTVTFGGVNVLTGSGAKQFHDVIIAGSFTPNSVYTITGILTITETGTLLPGGNTTLMQGADLAVYNAGTRVAAFNNLTIAEGSTLSTAVAFATNGTLQITGTLIAAKGFHAFGDVTVAVDTGRAQINAAFFVDGTLTVSSGAELIAAADAHIKGNVSASGTLTIAGTLYAEGTTNLTGAGIKQVGGVMITGSFRPAATLTVVGNFALAGSGTLLEGTSTTTFGGSASTYSATGTGEAVFHNVVVSAGSTLKNNSALTCNGTFRTAGMFTAAENFFIGGTCTISRGGSFATAGAHELSLHGNLVISGSFAATCPTRFTGTTRLSGAGTKLFQDVIIAGSLTAYAGPMTISGNIINDGTFIHNDGTVILTGATEKIISSSLSSPAPIIFNNLTLAGGSAAVDLRCEMNVSIEGIFSIATTTGPGTADVDGAANNRVFTLRSVGDNPANDASIGPLSPDAIINGAVTAQRYMSGEGRIYRYIATPVQGSGATVASWMNAFPVTGTFENPSNPGRICNKTVQPRSPSLYYYSEPGKSFVAYPGSGRAEDNPLTVGRGYAAYIRECHDSTLISVSGEIITGINRGPVRVAVSHTDSVLTYNNLIGNPFPSPIAWDRVQLNNIAPTIAIRDNGTGMFRYYSQGGAGANDVPHGVIAQGQAFWVRSTGPDPEVLIDENAKAAGPDAAGAVFFRTNQPGVLEILVNDSLGLSIDKAFAVLNSNASNGLLLDSFDAPKMNNQRDEPPEELIDLYTAPDTSAIPLAVNTFPLLNYAAPLPLIVRDARPGRYNFSFVRSGEFENVTLRIYDRWLNRFLEEAGGRSGFYVTNDPGSKSRSRFALYFSPSAITGLAKMQTEINVYPNPTKGLLSVELADGNADEAISVTDTSGTPAGTLLIVSKGGHRTGEVDLHNLPAGVYFIRYGADPPHTIRIVRE